MPFTVIAGSDVTWSNAMCPGQACQYSHFQSGSFTSVITPDIQGSSIVNSFFQSIRVTVMINEADYFEYFGSEIVQESPLNCLRKLFHQNVNQMLSGGK